MLTEWWQNEPKRDQAQEKYGDIVGGYTDEAAERKYQPGWLWDY